MEGAVKPMLKKYRMPNGKVYQYHEKDAPACAVPVEVEEKAVEPSNKAVKPANKARKAVRKK